MAPANRGIRKLPNGQRCELNRELFTLMVRNGHSSRTLARKAGVAHKTVEQCLDGWLPTPRVQKAIADQLQHDDGRQVKTDDIWSMEVQIKARAAKKRQLVGAGA